MAAVSMAAAFTGAVSAAALGVFEASGAALAASAVLEAIAEALQATGALGESGAALQAIAASQATGALGESGAALPGTVASPGAIMEVLQATAPVLLNFSTCPALPGSVAAQREPPLI